MLSVEGLSVFHGAVQALFGVSLAVAEGEVVALLGANGAGKSTLLASIAGLLPVAAGSIKLDGRDIANRPAHRIVREGIALVPERRDLFPEMTVAENLELGAYLRRDTAAIREELDRIYTLFPPLAKRRGQAALTLSGGEQQMLAIGRALMGRPRWLLLDEPSLGLSPLMLEVIFDIVARINAEERTAIFLVEQNTQVALAVASRAYVLETGRIVAEGSSAELAASDLVRQSFLGGERRRRTRET
jgi:branched-chain amino acid transport system ATP-binding protein